MQHERELAVLAYGSLLAHPGPYFGSTTKQLLRCDTPFPVEYVGQSKKRRGGAPTLARCAEARPVRGGLFVLGFRDTPAHLFEVRQQLALREGARDANSADIKDDLEMLGYRVIYSDFPRRIAAEALTARLLAEYAISSVQQCTEAGHPLCNAGESGLHNAEAASLRKSFCGA
jgi:hypothetical protein